MHFRLLFVLLVTLKVIGGFPDEARWSLQPPKGIVITSNGSSLGSFGSSQPETPLTIIEGSAEAQLHALQQMHTATLADLSSVTTKYRSALREIHDLSSQLKEANLSQGLAASEPLERNGSLNPFSGSTSGPGRRRLVRNFHERGLWEPPPFYRHAASAESLRSRSPSRFL